MLTDLLIVLVLTLLNGAFAMSELAIVSSRPARLRAMEARGSHRAAQALRLAEHPGRFLSTVQIGITLVGILAGAYSGARIGARFADGLAGAGLSRQAADVIGIGGAVVLITYISLIIGELVPKRIALRNPEGIAVLVAPVMTVLSLAAAPLVWLLDVSGRAVLFLIGQSGKGGQSVTDEEIRSVLAEAHAADVIEPEEMEMMAGVMRLADRSARGLMTPRHEVETVAHDADLAAVLQRFKETGYSRLPVEKGDDIEGAYFLRDFLDAFGSGPKPVPSALLRQVPIVSDRADALDVLKVLREGRDHLALVYDEFGHFEGIVTSGDFLGAITGGFDGDEKDEPPIVERDDGSWLVAGWMPADEFRDTLGVQLPDEGEYDTVAGFILSLMERLPELGEHVDYGDWRFEVVDLDGRRIDKVLASRTRD
ncbi:MAG: hemolysin family protein [Rhodobacteraceae bacterium]|nr:hemolysin family protein [Paracoccaceae bacterium]